MEGPRFRTDRAGLSQDRQWTRALNTELSKGTRREEGCIRHSRDQVSLCCLQRRLLAQNTDRHRCATNTSKLRAAHPCGQGEGLLSPCTRFLPFKKNEDSGLLPSAEKDEMNMCSEAPPRPQPPSPGKACDHGRQHQSSRTLVKTQGFPGPLHMGERENQNSPSMPTELLPRGSTIPHRETEGKAPSQCQRSKAKHCPTAHGETTLEGSRLVESCGAMTRFTTWTPAIADMLAWKTFPSTWVTSCQTRIGTSILMTRILPKL